MKIRLDAYVRVHMEAEIDARDEDMAYEEATGMLYGGMRALLHVPNADFDWEFDDCIAPEMTIVNGEV